MLAFTLKKDIVVMDLASGEQESLTGHTNDV
jgi:hypothetical protein